MSDSEFEVPDGRTCGSAEGQFNLLQIDPDYARRYEEIEQFSAEYVERYAGEGQRSGIVTIPVVVHVVFNTPTQNISDAQINSQIAILNQDFRRLNADASSVPGVFAPVAADARIQFRLAARDPNCNPTTGITRTATGVTAFIFDGTNPTAPASTPVKFTSLGGIDAWPSDRYLNIWVCNISGSLLGYSSFPGYPANVDGVVVDFAFFGNQGTAAAPFDRGRTATHEIGHWLNLFHIWGDDDGPGSPDPCAGSDQVADTPNQAARHLGCPSFPRTSCGNGPNGDMFMNYMDYVDDACMFMFTAGQAARMDATLAGTRSAIVASDALVPPPGFTADLWSQNTSVDIGDEPDAASAAMWLSDDIWVRCQDDGIVNQEHQNPEFRAGGAPNWVYVRVRNRGCAAAASGDALLYWAKASTALSWPAPWDGSVTSPALMGGQIGTSPSGNVAPRGFAILKFPWSPPDPADYASFGADQSHFCLLSRIVTSASAPFGMTIAEGSDLNANVRNNNNIAWKNITVVDDLPGTGRQACVTVMGIEKDAIQARLIFREPREAASASFFDRGVVFVDLGDKLFARWHDGGAIGDGIESGERGVYVVKPDAWIGNIHLERQDLFTICARHERRSDLPEGADVFLLDIIQAVDDGAEDQLLGGQRFVLKTLAN